MKKVRFIYNPYSGENAILKELDKIITMHQEKGYTIVPYRIQRGVDVTQALDIVDSTYEYILIAGGDGTIDTVVNAMKRKNIDIPIGIIPVGTANDFAKHLGMPQDAGACVEQILDSHAVGVDLGKVNDNYFVNVLSTGLFTDVSQKTDTNLKNTIGKLAYYLKGLEELPNFRKLDVKITANGTVFDEPIYLMLVFNGQTAGNFKLATKAKVQDGFLDVVVFKACHIPEIIPMFIKVLKGEHLDDPRIEYIKTDELLIESNEEIVTDIDGERGPDFPLRVQCVKDGIQVLGINK
ncbi:YegS/Rv2252/BmrU family lipid kinase [Clostridium sp. LIBA-8841]|uniref:YegS/Rv2252/BmrU family lipid kinase n=1 Tax=Clostridium sp. LIBA-8841 TaxID=2987530 RepID=UPI002AC45C3B|nr:YegS/Rv2252/BmrU family lipid kinase [Clostridium sp. LIBA-8841]MDZ5252225.1 YegS/Rv2252/BmrU family lipid kinase [Clostridium sp. LIBA-8841]